MNKTVRLLAVLFLAFQLIACASSRGVLDIPDQVVENPEQGQAVKIIAVNDKRVFELKPESADIPSLKNGEIDQEEITSRAFARKRNGYGKALGDIVLPEGRTVMQVVENRVANSLAKSGYRVLQKGDAGYDKALPVEVDIEEFWGWLAMKFVAAGINFKTKITITAKFANLDSGVNFDSHVSKMSQSPTGSKWLTVIELSLDELEQAIEQQLK